MGRVFPGTRGITHTEYSGGRRAVCTAPHPLPRRHSCRTPGYGPARDDSTVHPDVPAQPRAGRLAATRCSPSTSWPATPVRGARRPAGHPGRPVQRRPAATLVPADDAEVDAAVAAALPPGRRGAARRRRSGCRPARRRRGGAQRRRPARRRPVRRDRAAAVRRRASPRRSPPTCSRRRPSAGAARRRPGPRRRRPARSTSCAASRAAWSPSSPRGTTRTRPPPVCSPPPWSPATPWCTSPPSAAPTPGRGWPGSSPHACPDGVLTLAQRRRRGRAPRSPADAGRRRGRPRRQHGHRRLDRRRRARARRALSLLENGGKDPLVVDAGVDPAWAAGAGRASGAFTNAGQLCTAVERVYLHADVADAVLRELVRRAEDLVVGDPADPPHDARARWSTSAPSRPCTGTSRTPWTAGARLLTGGRRLDGPGLLTRRRCSSAAPTTWLVMTRGDVRTGGARCGRRLDLEEALRRAAGGRYGLAATVLTPETGHALRGRRASSTSAR